MKKVFLIFVVTMLSIFLWGCNENVSSKRFDVLVEDSICYNAVALMNYRASASEINRVYIPYSRQILISRVISFTDFSDLLQVTFLKKSKDYYYTYYLMESSVLYVFFDSKERCVAMIHLYNYFRDLDFSILGSETPSFEDVIEIDPSTSLLLRIPTILDESETVEENIQSEHILDDGSVVLITYQQKDGYYMVSEWVTFDKLAHKYLAQIKEEDLYSR